MFTSPKLTIVKLLLCVLTVVPPAAITASAKADCPTGSATVINGTCSPIRVYIDGVYINTLWPGQSHTVWQVPFGPHQFAIEGCMGYGAQHFVLDHCRTSFWWRPVCPH